MRDKDRTLDLTGFHRGNFSGTIRIRHLADWAYDYWGNGLKLARVKLNNDMYRELFHEIEQDNRYLRRTPFETLSIDLGFGEVELINVDQKTR